MKPFIATLLIPVALSVFAYKYFSEGDRNGNFRESASQLNAYKGFHDVDRSAEWIQEKEKLAQEKGHRLEFPPGLDYKEAIKMWHLSEGADIYPLKWIVNLRSLTSRMKNTYFLEKLDKKFGLISDPYSGEFPIPWVGLVAAWSESSPSDSDVTLRTGETIDDVKFVRVTYDQGKPKNSYAMMGTNCTFCHTAQMEGDNLLDGKTIIEGAPAMLNVRSFFNDLLSSTIKTMLTPDELEEFLKKNGYKGDAKEKAAKFSADFVDALKLKKPSFIALKGVLTISDILGRKLYFDAVTGGRVDEVLGKEMAKILKRSLFENRESIQKFLIELFKLTYNVDEVPQEIALRMGYISKLLGTDPELGYTEEGYARSDAFGRISNLTARENRPAPVTAPVSLPNMYAIQYKSMFHYSANTNSVLARNVGQSFGLGAIFTHPNAKGPEAWNTTANLKNLVEIEKYLYRLKVPRWLDHFKEATLDRTKVVQGCEIYHSKCIGCHGNQERVGPEKALIDYKVISHDKVKTDFTYIKNQMPPVLLSDGREIPFAAALSNFTKSIVKNYIDRHKLDDDTIAKWANSEIRGEEFFRDSYLGSEENFGPGTEYSRIEKGSGYQAKSLAGIWATAPYLHNGSVPTIFHLLQPSRKRPKRFFTGSIQYDQKNLGYLSDYKTVPDHEIAFGFLSKQRIPKKLKSRRICKAFPAYCLDTSVEGNSNQGHEPDMYMADGKEMSDEDKYALIEFLKVLEPELEYSWREKPIYKVNEQDGSCRLYE